jgi:coenzyme F420-reducing hydrogenase alpha subunit
VTKPATRRIEVGALTRVEGEGALQVEVVGDRVDRVNLSIYEPPRFFEALLVGRPLEDVPDITARICGICPVAYQNTSIFALEQALGIEVTPEIQQLRRLLYCAEWIESHGVHMHLLNIPDFFDCASSIDLAKLYPEEVNRGLRLKKHGNELLEILGGRAVHPINVTVGGFYRAPSRPPLLGMVDDLKWGLDASIDVARWVAGFDFPDFTHSYEMVALRHPTEYPMNHGRIVSTAGLDIEVQQYEDHFEERQVEHSTALHAVRIPEGRPYFVGPLARINQNLDRLSPTARQLAADVGITWPCFNPYQSIVARAIEVVQAYDEAIQIINQYQPPSVARIEYEPREGEGMAATEAPRGLIFHRYKTDQHGRITFAKIVPPTSQNQGQIERDLRELLPDLLQHQDPEIAIRCEKLIRTYDPCISCSTHFLKLDLKRR